MARTRTERMRKRRNGRDDAHGPWIAEPSSQVYVEAYAITALPQQLGWWSVLGETHRTYLPLTPHITLPPDDDLICQGEGRVTLCGHDVQRDYIPLEQR